MQIQIFTRAENPVSLRRERSSALGRDFILRLFYCPWETKKQGVIFNRKTFLTRAGQGVIFTTTNASNLLGLRTLPHISFPQRSRQPVLHCPKSNLNFREITWNVEENMILHELFRVVSRFPRYISRYITENRFPLGQCACISNVFSCATAVVQNTFAPIQLVFKFWQI